MLALFMVLHPCNTGLGQDDTVLGGVDFAFVKGGTFVYGNSEADENARSNEFEGRNVTMKRDFLVSRTEITVSQFALFVASTGYQTDAEQEGSDMTWKTDLSNNVFPL